MKTFINHHSWDPPAAGGVAARMWVRILGVFLVVAAAAGPLSGAELLTNGAFTNGLPPWKTNPAHGDWSPIRFDAAGEVYLHPDRPGQRGDVVYQPLNVTGIGGVTVTAEIRLRSGYLPAGRSFAAYLEYIDDGGARHRVQLLNPENGAIAGEWSTFTDTHTFPADAARLVRFSVAKEGDGQAYGDHFSLMADGVTVHPVPVITGLDPACGPHETLVTITGQHFGPAEGAVDFAGVPGIVESWSDTAITARVKAPSGTGRVTVWDANQVENHGVPDFHVTSPYLRAHVVSPSVRVVRGEDADFLVGMESHNGFMSQAGMSLAVVEPGVTGGFSPAPVRRGGGGLVSVPTASMNSGIHLLTIRASDGVYPPMDFPVSLQVVTITNIQFTTRNESYETVPVANPMAVTTQGDLVLGARFVDDTGVTNEFGVDYQVTSSNPQVVLVYPDRFGGYAMVAVGNGSSDITFTTPDGFSSSLTVNVGFPSQGAVTTSFLFLSVDNGGMTTNTFHAMSDVALTQIGRDHGISNVMSEWLDNNRQYQSDFVIEPGTPPGLRAIYAQTSVAKSVSVVTVTNAGDRGEIRGRVHFLNGAFMHGPLGNVVFHDAASGQPVFTNYFELGFVDNNYSMSYLPPGDYKILLEVEAYLPFEPRQWYPNGGSMGEAHTVSVPAGGVAEGVDFFLGPAPTVSLPEALEFCPPDLHSAGYDQLKWSGQQLVSFDGQDAAVTPAMPHNQLVFLEGTVVGPGTLSFYWKVSSEPEWDRLRFEMNFNEITNISGEVDWQQVTVSVPEGSTTVSWTYQKDVDTSAGHDAAWLDQVMFTPAGPAPPVITEHPRSMAAAPGADVTFTVTATGVGLDYQWQKDGENLPGQTGMSLTLNNVTTGNAGAYRVIVTNNEGSVTSDPANLVVGLPTAITVHPVSQTVGVNGETVLSVVATGTGLSYQWLVNGGTLPGETGSTLTLPPGGASAGRYQVDVTGLVGGTIRSDVATVTVIDLRMYAGITIHGRVGDRYRIDFTLDLNANPVNWMEVDTITLPGSPHYWFDLGSPGETMRYYRAVLLP